MSLPRIQNPEPIVVPAQEQQNFPDYYTVSLNFNVNTESPSLPMTARILNLPYNYDNNKFGPKENAKITRISNLKQLAEERALEGKPKLALALAAVTEAIAELVSEGI